MQRHSNGAETALQWGCNDAATDLPASTRRQIKSMPSAEGYGRLVEWGRSLTFSEICKSTFQYYHRKYINNGADSIWRLMANTVSRALRKLRGTFVRCGANVFIAIASVLLAAPPAYADEAPAKLTLSPAQLFTFADSARDRGDFATADAAYRALASNPDLQLRTEARFRLALMLADQQHKYRDAAVILRQILDEKPKAARVRLELARMDALMGHVASAERELRAAQATGLPPEVERMVRFYAGALSAAKPFGFSIEASIAPDTNINRATKSDTLGTIIGDFTLDQNAKAKSGVGLDLRGQAWLRHGLYKNASLVARISASGDIYADKDFDDIILSAQAGPEYQSGRDKIAFLVGPAWRWYDMQPYTTTISGSASWQHPVGRRTQIKLEGGVGHVSNRRNALQTGDSFSLGASVDRAFTARSGGGLQLSAARETAADPGYALASGGVSAYAFRELGQTTAVATLGYSHLEADARLFLYPRRRIDNRLSASLSATFRAFRVGPFAPLARLRWERNQWSIEIYDYRRFAGELGITAAF